MRVEDKNCSVCGEPLFLCYRDVANYVYKTEQRGFGVRPVIKYQCSYTCYLKAEKELNLVKKRMVK